MVLFKRKPIQFEAPPALPANATGNTAVWVIPETGEWFVDYDAYLRRLSFYNIKKFVCETSGNSNFTFFEALKHEHNELLLMQTNFPDPVKEPILRFVSFSTIPRIDQLVDHVYSKFKNEYFPGEKVILKDDGGFKVSGLIKEKIKFNEILNENGEVVKPAFISYRVLLSSNQTETMIEDSELISRERNRFTKSYVKTFLKISLFRSNRLGAPWVIREEIAKQYKITLEWPSEVMKFEYVNPKNSAYHADNGKTSSISNNHLVHKNISILNDDRRQTSDRSASSVLDIDSEEMGDKRVADSTSTNIFNSNESSDDYGMKCTRGASHTIFENLKETPPTEENLYKKWCDQWYKILSKTTAYFDDLESDNRQRDKVIKLFEFIGIKITNVFNPDSVHFIISQRSYSSKEKYAITDPFHWVSEKKIKIWHYEKCQRFCKSIKISNRKIDQLAKEKERGKVSQPIDSSDSINSFANIAPNTNGKGRKLDEDKTQKTFKKMKKEDSDADENNNKKLNETGQGNQEELEKKSHKPLIVEDLLLPSKQTQRPLWKKLSGPEFIDFANSEISVSDVLESWIFINMFHEAFVIDTFTFDDFLMALQWKKFDRDCPLLLEIICCLLSSFMNESGEMQITLPVDIETELKEKEIERKEKAKKLRGKALSSNTEKDDDDIIRVNSDSENDENTGNNESDSEYEEDEDINHNGYSILTYKKVSWTDRLKNRDFKNGHWIIILMGIFSICEYIPEYNSEINKILEILAPLNESPTVDSLIKNFYLHVGPIERISILSILMGLLLNGNTIRSHMEYVIEKSASLRRERFELQRELKLKIESGHNSNKELNEFLKDIDIKEIKQRVEKEEEKKAEGKNVFRGHRIVHSSLIIEPSPLEKAIGAAHPEFLKLLSNRTEIVKEIEAMKKNRSEIDRTLVDLNCSRVRYLGRDKFWNRYWWFERNGLPNLGSNKGDDDDDEDDDDDDDGDSDDDDLSKDLKDDSNSEYESETYLMGRIWVQGPSDVDSSHLNGDKGEVMKLKHLEEGADSLRNGKEWVYIDDVDTLNTLIAWLNDRGIRERSLKKELSECKERIISSFKTRQKFLMSEDAIKLEQFIKDLETPNDAKVNDLPIVKNTDSDIKMEDVEADSKNEVEIVEILDEDENNDDDDDEMIPRRRTRSNHVIEDPVKSSDEDYEQDEDSSYDSNEDAEDDDLLDDNDELEGEGQEVDADDQKRCGYLLRTLTPPGTEDKPEIKSLLISRAAKKLSIMQRRRRMETLALWVNSAAIEKFGHTHYAGPLITKEKKASKTRGRKKR